MDKRKAANMTRIGKTVLINSVVFLALLFTMEGIASYLRVGYHMLKSEPIAERKHTEYDEELGWVNLPNVHVKNMYGAGIYLRTNSQRHRNADDFAATVPDDKFRIICSGDSFTLGYGVSNDQAWCNLMTATDDQLESINLGQGGYGVDQAYLWFKRNDKELEYDAHIFAFITDDFDRMQHDTFVGYGKPYLEIRNNSIVQVNRPVPRRSYYVPSLGVALRTLRELNTVAILIKLSNAIRPVDDTDLGVRTMEDSMKLVSMIFAELHRMNKRKNAPLVLAYFPTARDYLKPKKTTMWRKFVQAEAQQNGYIYVDLVEELQLLPQGPEDLFSKEHLHFSVEGNKIVADILHRKLKEVLTDSNKLAH